MGRDLSMRLGRIVLTCLSIIYFCSLGMERISDAGRGSSVTASMAKAASSTVTYVRRLPTGNLGTAWLTAGRSRYSVSILALTVDTYVNSMGLLAVALTLAALVGLATGVLSAMVQGSPVSLAILTTSLLGISLPTFFTALLLQILEIWWYQRTGVRLVPVGGFGWDRHLILPALVLAARPLAQISRMTSVSLSESAGQDYVRTARAKGLATGYIWRGHILPNAAVAILTAVGVSMRFALGSLPIVEYYFGWPGMGAALLNAIHTRQTNLVITLALALALTFMCVNMVLEASYRLVDPRMRADASQL